MTLNSVWSQNEKGVRIETPPDFWRQPLGMRLAIVLDDWLEQELATVIGDSQEQAHAVVLHVELWRHLEAPEPETQEYEQRLLFDELIPVRAQRWEVASRSFAGAPRLDLDLLCNGHPVPVSDFDFPSLRTAPQALLTPEAYGLCTLVSAWNKEPVHSVAAQFETIAAVQKSRTHCVLRGEDVKLDEHLAAYEIRRAEKVRLGWEPSERRSDVFDLRAQLRTDVGDDESFSLDDLDSERPVAVNGKKVVLFDEETAQAARHVRGKQQSRSRKQVQRAIHDPLSVLPEGIAPDSIDLSEYSHRISGFEPIARAARAQDIKGSGVNWFGDEPSAGGAFLELEVTSGPSEPPVHLEFDSPEEVETASNDLARELERPQPSTLNIGGANVLPTEPLKERLDLELDLYRKGQPRDDGLEPPPSPPPKLVAVIDEDAVFDSEEGRRLLEEVPWAQLDRLLKDGVRLKDHQREGLAWMWFHYGKNCPGVLLADDMGLGKTLQLASLLALTKRKEDGEGPSIVVAPVVLLENWRAELARFFQAGAFGKVVILHGDGLSRLRQGAGLDLGVINEADLIITNYETLSRYQLSLLKVDWNVVVLDESHAIKNPDTLRTRAACGLKRRFAVCMTGTPVENGLLDVWSQFFFLSPQDPFEDKASFVKRDGESTGYVREALGYPSWTSRVLRRTKAILDLPPKEIVHHDIPMSAEQASMENSILKHTSGVLEKLQHLRKLYAHPLLMHGKEADPKAWQVERALQLSPKFARCLDLLEEVRERGEKVLIFSLYIQMQALLSEAIKQRFGLKRVGVINGGTNQSGRTMQTIDSFSNSDGFDVLILSPIAAGVGLNIVAANHVIHYDRWWNPAKEDQATDRAYRIGQTRTVNVHYLLLHQPGNVEAGFDKRLHELVEKKRQLATDFLAPSDSMEANSNELFALFGQDP